MTSRYFQVEVIRADSSNRMDDDMVYYGSDPECAFNDILKIIKAKDVAYRMIGEALIRGESKYEYSWNNKDFVLVTSWEDDDGSDETWDD